MVKLFLKKQIEFEVLYLSNVCAITKKLIEIFSRFLKVDDWK